MNKRMLLCIKNVNGFTFICLIIYIMSLSNKFYNFIPIKKSIDGVSDRKRNKIFIFMDSY